MRIAVCDDDRMFLEKMEHQIRKVMEEVEVVSYQRAVDFLYDLQEGRDADLLFADVEMPDLNGMDLVKKAKEVSPYLLVVLVSDYTEYAVDGYELSVFRFIPKTQLEERLETVLADAVKEVNLQKDRYLVVEKRDSVEKIAVRDIAYMEKVGKNSVMHLRNGSTVSVRMAVSLMNEMIPSEDFVFVDRGLAVNLAYVQNLTDGIVILEDGTRIPVSRSRQKNLRERILRFWGE